MRKLNFWVRLREPKWHTPGVCPSIHLPPPRFYQLTRRLPHEGLEYDDERIITHLYYTFCNESIKLLGKTVMFRVNVLSHLLAKIGKEPNADLFPFVKGASHQRTEEEIKFVFEHLGWSYSPIQLD